MEIEDKEYQKLKDALAQKDARIKELESLVAQLQAQGDKKQKGFLGKLGKNDTKEPKPRKKSNQPPTLAVHMHLYYVDQLSEFISYLENIPYKFDLYVSCQEGTDLGAVKNMLKPVKKIQVLQIMALMDKGRDLAPFFVKFNNEILKHDYALHIHTKNSKQDNMDMRYGLEVLLGSKERVDYIINLFENENAGLVYPDIQEEGQSASYSWLSDYPIAEPILSEAGIDEVPQVFNYPTESYFWVRTRAIRDLLSKGYTYEDFPREMGQNDGTLYHALKRVLPFVSRSYGYDDYILYLNTDDTRKNKSIRPFLSHFKVDRELLVMKLGNYDIVSFDIFDTLMTLTVPGMDDIYKIVGQQLKEKYDKDVDFLTIRKAAEARAIAKYGPVTNIDKIYVELFSDKEIGDIAPSVKELEIDTLYKHCVPRVDMVNVYNSLKNMGRHIILVSDMYLTKAHLVGMLRKCKIGNYEELFIGWEIGASKKDGSIYDAILSGIPKDRYIHVGDDFYEDGQVLTNRGVANHIVLSPGALLELSDFPQAKEAVASVENALVVGSAINGNIFNSPFAYDENGKAKMDLKRLAGLSNDELVEALKEYVKDEDNKY